MFYKSFGSIFILFLRNSTESKVIESKPNIIDILTCMLPIYKYFSRKMIAIYDLMQYEGVRLIRF